MSGHGQTARGAVIFDCDGLLLDTEECWTKAAAALLAAHGHKLDPRAEQLLLGKNAETAGQILAGLLARPGEEAKLAERLLELAWVEVLAGARPRPGAADLVSELHGRIPIGVASNSPQALAEAALEVARLGGAFEVIVGEDKVREPKPAPDVYTTACARLGASPCLSVALEDSPTGIAAARAAGLHVIGVPSRPGIELDADEVVYSLAHPAVRTTIKYFTDPDRSA
jgi:HAD superfamily hydrolase (TIGR01509 family)